MNRILILSAALGLAALVLLALVFSMSGGAGAASPARELAAVSGGDAGLSGLSSPVAATSPAQRRANPLPPETLEEGGYPAPLDCASQGPILDYTVEHHPSSSGGGGEDEFLVSAKGYLSRNISRQELEAGVCLEPCGVIQGSVIYNQTPQPSLAQVVAWAEGSSPPSGVDAQAQAGDTWAIVRCSADGRFLIEGLSFGVSYKVAAFGEGFLPKRVEDGVAPNGPPLTLDVVPGCAAVLRLTDAGLPDETAIRTGGDVHGGGIYWGPMSRDFTSADDLYAVIAALWGVPYLRGSRNERLVVFRASSSLSVGEGMQISFQADVPGYQELAAEVPVPAFSFAPHVSHVGLVPQASEWGDVELHVANSGLTSDLIEGLLVSGVESERVVGVLRLSGKEGGQPVRTLELSVRMTAFVGGQLISGVPSGAYEARLTLADWGHTSPDFKEPGLEVSVEAAGLSAVDVRFENSGPVSFIPIDSRGADYRGELTLLLERISSSGEKYSGAIFFEGPPYVAPSLPAMEFSVPSVRGRRSGGWVPQATLFSPVVGASEEVVLLLK
jgi:hypothetical protein